MASIGRRRFLTVGAGAVIPAAISAGKFGWDSWHGPVSAQTPPGPPTLPGRDIPKYAEPLTVLPAMPRSGRTWADGKWVDYYEISQRQLQQQVLPAGLPATTVWGYGSVHHPSSFHYPAYSFEARTHEPVRVRWTNELRTRTGRYRPHLFAVDPTLHWANPPGGIEGRDSMPVFDQTPGPYTGPVPMVVHLHGSDHSTQESDGHPEAWYLPDCWDIPRGYARTGSTYDGFRRSASSGWQWGRGAAVFDYPNEQDPATLWFHDHTLGLTRLNVYAGLAGLYLLRGDEQLGYPEIPLIIQDRLFNADGSLWYPPARELLDGFTGPFVPDSEVPPIWVPGFLGDTIVVNGKTWPYLDVEQRRYRFRVLNACNARVLFLQTDQPVPLWQIGADGGFLPAPTQLNRLLLGPAERADVVVDFSQVPVGTTVTLLNLGPENGPFFGGEPGTDFPPSDPDTTGQVLQFRVVARNGADTSAHPGDLQLAAAGTVAAAEVAVTRQVSLNDIHSDVAPHGHLKGALGTVGADGSGTPYSWHETPTETPRLGTSEVWEIHNFTPEVHPVHLHATQFQVVDRQPFGGGSSRPPQSWETGKKDTVLAYPFEITRVRPHFAQAGLFTWHCHIIEHEDNEMMRPLQVD